MESAASQAATFTGSAIVERGRAIVHEVTGSTTAADLRPGEAARVEAGGRAVAAHCDRDGRLHTYSATCPHMGCLVDLEPVSREWQCPCHGSRFDLGGKVLEGPATTGLTRVDLDD